MGRFAKSIPLLLLVFLVGSCTSPVQQDEPIGSSGGPSEGVSDPEYPYIEENKSSPITVFDSFFGSLDDPEFRHLLATADIFITDPSKFWGRPDLAENLNLIRAINPRLKVLGFFRTKCVRTEWSQSNPPSNFYNYELYQTAQPFFSFTTEGDTLSDWPGVVNYNFLDSEARQEMLGVFKKYQDFSGAPLDGVFWDYFNYSLWISPDVQNVHGEPDLDGDGIVHWSDADELEAFQAASVSWISEMRSAMGEDFIQVVNGGRALSDSTFAGLVDGMFYETFPYVGYNSPAKYRDSLDSQIPNNLWAAGNWPRTENGGPWLILSNIRANIRFYDFNGDMRILNLGDLNRAVALLTDATYVYYDMTGERHAGFPTVELALGQPITLSKS
jgi:hypothetical protein